MPRDLVASHADVLRGSSRVPDPTRGTGTRDEPLITSSWEARDLEDHDHVVYTSIS